MLKKILFVALTVALMSGCHAAGPARMHYTGAVAVSSGHYAPAPVVVHRPAPVVYRPAPPPPRYAAPSHKPAPPPPVRQAAGPVRRPHGR